MWHWSTANHQHTARSAVSQPACSTDRQCNAHGDAPYGCQCLQVHLSFGQWNEGYAREDYPVVRCSQDNSSSSRSSAVATQLANSDWLQVATPSASDWSGHDFRCCGAVGLAHTETAPIMAALHFKPCTSSQQEKLCQPQRRLQDGSLAKL